MSYVIDFFLIIVGSYYNYNEVSLYRQCLAHNEMAVRTNRVQYACINFIFKCFQDLSRTTFLK